MQERSAKERQKMGRPGRQRHEDCIVCPACEYAHPGGGGWAKGYHSCFNCNVVFFLEPIKVEVCLTKEMGRCQVCDHLMIVDPDGVVPEHDGCCGGGRLAFEQDPSDNEAE